MIPINNIRQIKNINSYNIINILIYINIILLMFICLVHPKTRTYFRLHLNILLL